MKKHDEIQVVLQLQRRKFAINPFTKKIAISKTMIIGNKTWGKLDFLTHYCGYYLVYGDGTLINESTPIKRDSKQEKRDKKAHKLSNKLNPNRNGKKV